MASGLLLAVNSILGQIGEIPFAWNTVDGAEKSRPTYLFQLVRMWNNQVNRSKDGSGYAFEAPACFVEMLPEQALQMAENVTVTDMCWRLHIVDVELNTVDEDNMDQNLSVIRCRDLVKQYMVGFQPEQCSTMFCENERQDFDHSDMYHYTVDMKCCFRDTKGSIEDPDQTKVIYSTPPTGLELDLSFTTDPEDVIVSEIFNYKPGRIHVLVTETPNPANTQVLVNGVEIPVEYALNLDGTLTIPYLIGFAANSILTPFMLNNDPYNSMPFDPVTGTFDNSANNGFNDLSEIDINVTLPL